MIERNSPIQAFLKCRFLLTKGGSSKTTYHLELDISASALFFEPGDSVGVFAQNDPQLVRALMMLLGADAESRFFFERKNSEENVGVFLTSKANLFRLTSGFVRVAVQQMQRPEDRIFLETLDKEKLHTLLEQLDPLGFLQRYPVTLPAHALCNQFAPLLPRFYSIASSPLLHPTKIDLTVALTSFTIDQRHYHGVASHFLCHLAKLDETPIPIYVQPAHHFRPPAHETDMIMIGPGTGIAPFRAFMQQRISAKAPGKNWLFFGERQRAFDFFYEDFWQQLAQAGLLKLDLAFSRDQAEKVYVQHRMLEQAQELWQWLNEGAKLYVCGDASRMAKNVEQTLLQIVEKVGQKSPDEAKHYLRTLRKEKRYLTDVY